MGLFDNIFKKKQNGQTTKDNLTLEQLLQKAATEPAFRAEFYKLPSKFQLIKNDIFFINIMFDENYR